jgi:hypothetical protein
MFYIYRTKKTLKSFFDKIIKKYMQPKNSIAKWDLLHMAAKRIFQLLVSQLYFGKMKIGHF